MDLWRFQLQLRIPYAPNPDGWYYWTNSYLYDLDQPPDPPGSSAKLQEAARAMHLNVVERYAFRLSPVPDGNSWTSTTEFGQKDCGLGVESGWSLLNTIYVRHMVAGKQVGFTRWRMPVQASDIEGGMLHPDFAGFAYNTVNFYLRDANVCSREGALIDEFLIDPQVRGWQMRDGGERRKRKVFEA